MKKLHPYIRNVLHNPLLLILIWSLLAIGTVWIRVLFSGTDYYVFMVWNLILALVPLLISSVLVMRRYKKRTLPFTVAGAILVWLVFYPNALYMITDFVHLKERNGIPLWYDIILLMSFTCAGLYIGFVSLSHMHIIIRRMSSAAAGWVFTYITLFLSGFGVYFGRFMRWNSWDLFFHPAKILRMSSAWLLNPLDYPQILIVSVLFSGFFILFYHLLIAAHDSFFNRKFPDVH